MAMVLDAFASYVGDLLKQVVEDEVGMLLGVTGDIENMGVKLGDLKKFLADADRRNITDESVQGWVTELKRAMYEATDILDLCQLKAMETEASSVNMGCFNPLLFCLRNPIHAHDIGIRIKELNQRLDMIKERSSAFNFINLGPYEDRSSKVVNPRRETSGELDRSGLVGEKIEQDTRTLVAKIVHTDEDVNNDIMVVAIVGVGGIGKTTLAQKVFNDDSIQGEFSKKIWLSINQNFSEVELLRRAIIEAGGDHQPAGNAKATLQRTLKDVLAGHKTLLVMDDVWNHEAWEGVLRTPIENSIAPCCRVLVTTRDEGVARGMKAVRPYHHVDKLEDEDAWSLLKKQVLSSEIDEDHINTLKDIGMKIIEKCGGLPLAVKVMGGLLRQKEMLHRDWKQVMDDSKWSITQMPQELNYAVYLSYKDMPPYLKQCFLYYSLLPKSRKFSVFQVVSMWISEGFICGNSDDLEESGRNYYKELICRNLIEPDSTSYVEQWVCSVHDVVRSFAHYMARDEALVAQDGEIDVVAKLNSQNFLRLSIEANQLQSGEPDWKSLQKLKSVRTLISTIQINMRLGDSLAALSSLRTLHIESADVAALFESLPQLKHLRYLALVDYYISALPGNIGKMKLLQFLDICGCGNLESLPDSIVKLGQLRYLNLPNNVSMIPRGIGGLTNMRILGGFPAYMDGDWCSLDELGPLSQLRLLRLAQLENVSTASSAANARLGDKRHMVELFLSCTTRRGCDVTEEEQGRIEEVFNELCPPSSVEYLFINGYFGQQLPSWMMSMSMVPLNNLKFLLLFDLTYCTQLPNGLCQLPCLQFLQLRGAPYIRHVQTDFLQPSQAATAPFPRLNKMVLKGMVEWEEWEWKEEVQAMHRLEELLLKHCKLRRLPPGLASQARALRKLSIKHVQHISYLENFPFVVELGVDNNLDLERITDLTNLQKLDITACRKLRVLKGVPALERLVLQDYAMDTLPEYLRDVNPRYLELKCSLPLLTSMAAEQSGPELAKFSHVEHVKAYANGREWYMSYRRGTNSFDTNINRSFLSRGTLYFFEDTQRLESVLKMPRRTFHYICSLVKKQSLQDMNSYSFLDGRLLCLEDQVAVALIVLNSGETLEAMGSSLCMNETTISLVTKSFVYAMSWQRWPGTDEMEKIKYKFDQIHGLPNCCGVLHTTCEKNDSLLMQVIVDSDMRFTDVELGWSDSQNQLSILNDSYSFKKCQEGALLNGSKLKVSSDGSEEVGEYVIGDAGYPLLPWLLTPYQLENDLSESKVEFNKRHSETTGIALKALTRLKDKWKWLHAETWHPKSQYGLQGAIRATCRLHNIVIDMEEEDAGMPSDQKVNYSQQMRQLSDEDPIRVRDILCEYLTRRSSESGVDPVDQEERQEQELVSSGSADKEQQEPPHPLTAEEEKQC